MSNKITGLESASKKQARTKPTAEEMMEITEDDLLEAGGF